MFKKNVLFSITFLCITLLMNAGCASLDTSSRKGTGGQNEPALQNTFSIPEQKVPPQEIQSVQLYKKGEIESAPVIALNSSEKLSLEFDYLGEGTKQFKLQVSHRSKNWEESPLPLDFYLSGFSQVYFSGGSKSFSQRPSYFHYSYEFPNSQLSFKVSGNYL
ncbi:MAG: type IX secretion system plug protein domain-containing protein, partial [Candidatus Halalkalibacterium sp. M3_1C_030]